jgi:hypothetical protein
MLMCLGIRGIHARSAFQEARLTSAATSLQSLFRGVYVISFVICLVLTSFFAALNGETFAMMSRWLSIFNHVCAVDSLARN